MRMNRGFDVVIIDEAAQAVRTLFLGRVRPISFQTWIQSSINFLVMGSNMVDACTGGAFYTSATCQWLSASISGTYMAWEDF